MRSFSFVLKLLIVLRQYREQLLEKWFQSRRKNVEKVLNRQVRRQQSLEQSSKNGKKPKEECRSKLTADFLCFSLR